MLNKQNNENKEDDGILERPVMRTLPTVSLKEIFIFVSLVASAVFAYGTISARVLVLEEAYSTQSKTSMEWRTDMKMQISEMRSSINDSMKTDSNLKSVFDVKLDKIEERLRVLEIKTAREKYLMK